MSSKLRAIARETVSIADRGWYQTASGDTVDISADMTRAVSGTRIYQPEDVVRTSSTVEPVIEVVNESSLEVTRRLGGDVACLVFASARNPGGGFLNGAQAQEESLARGSALYPCLRAARDFYVTHRANSDLTYSDRVIYSPSVPVFRDDEGTLLDKPYLVSFLTAAAPNRSAILRNQPHRADYIPEVLRRRAMRVLEVVAANGHRSIVLGAWGCGVFGNEPSIVADVFAEALQRGRWFEHVTFAVLDRGRGEPTYKAFRERLN